jgi:hypothetical protein
LVSFAALTLPAGYRVYSEVAPIAIAAAFLVALLLSAIPLRQRLRLV